MSAARRRRGGLSPKLRFAILKRDGFRCRYCGREAAEVALHVDHIVARARGGTDDESNLVAACVDCNLGKGVRAVGQPSVSFLSWLLAQAERDDWVGDLARDEVERPGLVEPESFKHLSKQIRDVGGRDEVVRAAWHAWREYRHRGGRPTRRMLSLQELTAPRQIVAVAESLGAKLVLVAEVQLKKWIEAPSRSIWNSLYEWLTTVGYKERDVTRRYLGPQSLHSRTYCGDALMERLLAAERLRLRGQGVRGKRALKSMAWSNAGSGPMGQWRSHKLLGDGLFVLQTKEQLLGPNAP